MNEIVFLLCQKPSTALKNLLIYNVFTRAAEGTEAGDGGRGGVNVGHSLSPPSHFMLATGLIFITVFLSSDVACIVYTLRRYVLCNDERITAGGLFTQT